MATLTKKIFALHSWLGLISGLCVLMFFTTGAIIVFGVELNNAQYPHLFKVEPQKRRLPYDELYRKAQSQAAHLYLYSFRHVPKTPEETTEMRVYSPALKEYGLLYLNPYTGKVLGATWNNSVFDILLELHYTLYLGRIGELLAGIFALCLLGSIITGTVVYRKFFFRALTFRVAIDFKNWRTAASGLHRVLGVWALLFNFILGFSGFYMMLYAFDLKAQFGSAADDVSQPPPAVKANLDKLISIAEKQLGDRNLTYVDFPRKDSDNITVSTDGDNWLLGEATNSMIFDRATGAVLKTTREQDMTPKEKFEYALYTLHFGQYGGAGIKILYSFFGLSGAFITITGFMLYWRKKRNKPFKKSPAPRYDRIKNNQAIAENTF